MSSHVLCVSDLRCITCEIVLSSATRFSEFPEFSSAALENLRAVDVLIGLQDDGGRSELRLPASGFFTQRAQGADKSLVRDR